MTQQKQHRLTVRPVLQQNPSHHDAEPADIGSIWTASDRSVLRSNDYKMVLVEPRDRTASLVPAPSADEAISLLGRISALLLQRGSSDVGGRQQILGAIASASQIIQCTMSREFGRGNLWQAEIVKSVFNELRLILHDLDTLPKYARARFDRLSPDKKWKPNKDIQKRLGETLWQLCDYIRLESSRQSQVPPSQPGLQPAHTRVADTQPSLQLNSGCCSNKLRQAELARLSLPATGEWLLERPEWVDFADRDTEMCTLWLQGKPGSGKTGLMSTIIERLSDEAQARASNTVIYYYFDIYTRPSVSGAVASLLRQLLSQNQQISKILARRWESRVSHEDDSKMPKSQSDQQEMVQELLDLIPKFDNPYICLDGLDACDDTTELVKLIRKLVSAPCRLLLTSRRLEKLEYALDGAAKIQIELHNTADIEMFARGFRYRYPELGNMVNGETLSRISHKLALNAAGSFLMPILLMKEISRQTTVYELEESIETLPADIEGAFQFILDRIAQQSSERAKLAMRVLTWMAYAQRPLAWRELQQAVALELDQSRQMEDFIDVKRYPTSSIIEEVCMGFVTIDVALNRASAIHTSFVHYLQAFRRTILPSGEGEIASCLEMLLRHELLQTPATDIKSLDSLMEYMPLVVYAAQCWGYHVRGQDDETMKQAARILSNIPAPLVQILHVSGHYGPRDPTQLPSKFLPIHFAAYFDLPLEIVTDLPIAVHEKDSWDRTSLHIRCQNSLNDAHDACNNSLYAREIVQRLGQYTPETSRRDDGQWTTTTKSRNHIGGLKGLLESVSDRTMAVNSLDKYQRSPLHYAVLRGSHVSVLELLKDVTDIHVMDIFSHTALDYAIESGRIDIMLSIVQSIPRPQGPPMREPNALSIAAANGYDDIARFLVRSGWDDGKEKAMLEAAKNGHVRVVKFLAFQHDDINFSIEDFDEGKAALHYAASTANLEMAIFLMRLGAFVDQCDHRGRTPLWFTADIGDWKIADLLLRAGARADITDRDGRGPLYQATASNHAEIIRLLIRFDRRGVSRTLSNKALDARSKELQQLTPLQLACREGFVETAQILARRGNPDHVGETGRTPLSYAAEEGHTAIVRILLATGRVDVNAKDTDGHSITLLAVKGDHADIVTLLLEEEKNLDTESRDEIMRSSNWYALEITQKFISNRDEWSLYRLV